MSSVNMPSTFKYSMSVRFIRPEDVEGNGKNDDRATITSLDDGVYQLTYTFGDCKKSPIVKEAILDHDDVIRWFNRTLHFVDADYCPFARYQFDFSLMPSIMIAHQELHHHHKVIMSAVRFHLDNWMNEDDFEEEEDEEENCCEEDDYDEEDEIYESNQINNCDDNSSLSSDEYVAPVVSSKHKFFNEEGKDSSQTKKENISQVQKMIQNMEQKAKSTASNLRR
jgi:hypothetical protein